MPTRTPNSAAYRTPPPVGPGLGLKSLLRSYRDQAAAHGLNTTASFWGEKLLWIPDLPSSDLETDAAALCQIIIRSGRLPNGIRAVGILYGSSEVTDEEAASGQIYGGARESDLDVGTGPRGGSLDSSLRCARTRARGLLCQRKPKRASEVLAEAMGSRYNRSTCPWLWASLSTLLGECHMLTGGLGKATRAWEQALKAQPLCFEAYLHLIQYRLLPQNKEQLLEECIYDRVPKNLGGLFPHEVGKLTFAQPVVLDLSNSPCSQYISALEALRTQAASQAVAVMEQYIDDVRWKLSRLSRSYHLDSLWRPFMVQCYLEAGNDTGILEIARDMVQELEPLKRTEFLPEAPYRSSIMDCMTEATFYFVNAAYYYYHQQHEKAKAFVARSLHCNPCFGAAKMLLGHVHVLNREHQGALDSYWDAAGLMKGSPRPLMGVAMTHLVQDEPQNAKRIIDLICVRFGGIPADDLDMMMLTARYDFCIQEYSQAIEDLSRLRTRLEVGRGAPRAWECVLALLGHAYRLAGDFGKAIQIFQDVLAHIPQSIYALEGAIITSILAGEHQTANEYYDQARASGVGSRLVSRIAADRERARSVGADENALPNLTEDDRSLAHLPMVLTSL